MGGHIPKQFLSLGGQPILVQSLRILQASPVIHEIILAVPQAEHQYCLDYILATGEFGKVMKIVPGGFNHWWVAFAMVVLVPSALALVFGWLAFRSRVTGVYLSIITQALSYALMLAFFRNDMGFGGNNGFTDFKDILGFDLQSDSTRTALVVLTAVVLAASYTACTRIVDSRAGRVLRAIRDAESRTRFLGYRVENYKLWLFVFSAAIAGIAGALYVPQIGIINPSEFAPINSIEVVIWVAVGGRGTLYGALIGAVLVNYAKTYFTGAFPEVWLYALGALFVLVTLFLPRGVTGLLPSSSAHEQA